MPGLRPPPAMKMVKANGWWSRPRLGLPAVRPSRNGGWHAEGQLVLGDPRARLRAAQLRGLDLVEVAQRVEAEPPHRAVHALRVGDVQDRVTFGAALHALVHRRQKATIPVAVAGA